MADIVHALRFGYDGPDPAEHLSSLLGPEYSVEYGKSDKGDVIRVVYRGEDAVWKKFRVVILSAHPKTDDVVASPIGSTSRRFLPTIGRLAHIAKWIRADGINIRESLAERLLGACT